MQNWGNIQDVEFVANQSWKQYRCGVADITGTAVTMKQPCWSNAHSTTSFTMGDVTWIENAYELLDSPGEWYLNRTTGWLYYVPKPGEDMTTAEVIAPILQTLVSGNGVEGNVLHNIQFQGVVFSYAGWNGPSGNDGYPNIFANYYGDWSNGWEHKIPANVDFDNADSITFDRDVFAHLGAVGFSFGAAVSNSVVSGSNFSDISGNAVMVGDVQIQTPAIGNQVIDNYIHNIGAEYQDSVGIFFGFTKDSIIGNNELHDLPYSAISIGKANANQSMDNEIRNNLIDDIMKTLRDGGGVYSGGAQPGNIYSGNVITGDHGEHGALYLDNFSRYIELSNNVVFGNYRTALIKGGDLGDGVSGGDHNIHDNWWQDRGTVLHDSTGTLEPDIWYFIMPNYPTTPTPPGPNTVTNNHVITSLNDAPSSIIDSAGLEAAYENIRSDVTIPIMATQASSTVGATSAVGNGNIIDVGGENPIRYIEWGTTSGNYADSCTAGSGGVGAYTCNMTNLTPNTVYYARAKATNSAGTSYGAEVHFMTASAILNAASSPIAFPDEGTYHSPQSITLTTDTPGASIYFTTDGSNPTSSSSVYSQSIVISATTTLKTFAAKGGMTDSEEADYDYVIDTSEQQKVVKEKRAIRNSQTRLHRGDILYQSGRRFSQRSHIALYFEKYGGGYYDPIAVKTDKDGSFVVTYVIPENKHQGTYSWYAKELKTGKKSDTIYYRVK